MYFDVILMTLVIYVWSFTKINLSLLVALEKHWVQTFISNITTIYQTYTPGDIVYRLIFQCNAYEIDDIASFFSYCNCTPP